MTELGNITLSSDEEQYLRTTCTYLSEAYLGYLKTFKFRPKEQVRLSFHPDSDTGQDSDAGAISLEIEGKWLETILYEIPLLALVSEVYFKFVDRDWTYDGQVEKARHKAEQLCKNGCLFSEFGSRRRRDYHTHDLVLRGLKQGSEEFGGKPRSPGKLTGTSNVHFAMKHGIPPVGTVAHEFFMAVAAVTNDYEHANEASLRYWIGTYGEGVSIILESCLFRAKLTYKIGARDRINRYVWHSRLPKGFRETSTIRDYRPARRSSHLTIRGVFKNGQPDRHQTANCVIIEAWPAIWPYLRASFHWRPSRLWRSRRVCQGYGKIL